MVQARLSTAPNAAGSICNRVNTEQVLRRQQGVSIQNAMPELPPADRELFISGIYGDCECKGFGRPDADELQTAQR
jgi:hypothetical protein